MLEKMDDFFNSRQEIYDDHQRSEIAGAREFYPFTASCLPRKAGCRILDLGCGTGLELEDYFSINPTAQITGIDLAERMLRALEEKFPDKALTLLHGSYFEIPFESCYFDGVVSVESLHHFSKEEKRILYQKVRQALKPDGYFILTDYFAASEAQEAQCHAQLLQLKRQQGISDGGLYHYDTPLTLAHELEVLHEAGFSAVTMLKQWSTTCTIKAEP